MQKGGGKPLNYEEKKTNVTLKNGHVFENRQMDTQLPDGICIY